MENVRNIILELKNVYDGISLNGKLVHMVLIYRFDHSKPERSTGINDTFVFNLWPVILALAYQLPHAFQYHG